MSFALAIAISPYHSKSSVKIAIHNQALCAIFCVALILCSKQLAIYLTATAVESDLFCPAIGGTLLAQGILNTAAYHKYGNRPRKALDANYKGAVAGTVGTSIAVGGTAIGISAFYWEYYRLHKQGKLPIQLIRARLKHLDEVDAQIKNL